MRLQLLNLARWFREYLLVWTALSFVYSITLVLVLQPLLELALKMEVPFWPLWIATCATLIFPAAVEALPQPLSAELGRLSFGHGLIRLYLRHEFRRLGTWVGILVAVALAAIIPKDRAALWILIAQFPMQRALFSFQKWRVLALVEHPKLGSKSLMLALASSQLLQFLVAWLAVGAIGFFDANAWLKLGLAGVAAVFAASAVCLEGDAGRPGLVNFITLAAAALGGFSTYAWPVGLGISAYLMMAMSGSIPERIRSVEHLDEDTLIP